MAELDSTPQHKGDSMSEKNTLRNCVRVTESGQIYARISSSRDMGGSYSTDSEASTSPP